MMADISGVFLILRQRLTPNSSWSMTGLMQSWRGLVIHRMSGHEMAPARQNIAG